MTDGWSTFGKGSAAAVGLAAAGSVLYFIGNGLYQWGHSKAEKAAEEKYRAEINAQSKEHRAEIKAQQDHEQTVIDNLLQMGRLIPEESCLRYKVVESKREGSQEYGRNKRKRQAPDEIISGTGNCSPLEVTVSWHDSKREKADQLVARFKDHKAVLNGQKVEMYEHKKAAWHQYKRKGE